MLCIQIVSWFCCRYAEIFTATAGISLKAGKTDKHLNGGPDNKKFNAAVPLLNYLSLGKEIKQRFNCFRKKKGRG